MCSYVAVSSLRGNNQLVRSNMRMHSFCCSRSSVITSIMYSSFFSLANSLSITTTRSINQIRLRKWVQNCKNFGRSELTSLYHSENCVFILLHLADYTKLGAHVIDHILNNLQSTNPGQRPNSGWPIKHSRNWEWTWNYDRWVNHWLRAVWGNGDLSAVGLSNMEYWLEYPTKIQENSSCGVVYSCLPTTIAILLCNTSYKPIRNINQGLRLICLSKVIKSLV